MLGGSNLSWSVALTVTAASGDGVEHAPADVLAEGVFTAPPVSELLQAMPEKASVTIVPATPKRFANRIT
jgi:hypothetical protein